MKSDHLDQSFSSLQRVGLVLSGCLTLLSCGGGGGSSEAPESRTPAATNVVPNDLYGRIYFREKKTFTGDRGALARMELPSGIVSSISEKSGSYFDVATDESFFAKVITGGNEVKYFSFSDAEKYQPVDLENYHIGLPIKLSKDDQYLAAILSDGITIVLKVGSSGSEQLVGILKENEIFGLNLDKDMTSVEWLSDGSLIFSYHNKIYQLTNIHNAAVEYEDLHILYEYPNENYHIHSITVGPDSEEIAFLVNGSDRPSGDIFITNLETSDTRQITETGQGFSHMAWSSNGKYLAAIFGGSIYQEMSGVCGTLWVFDANQEGVSTVEWDSWTGDTLGYRLERVKEGKVETMCVGDGLDWR